VDCRSGPGPRTMGTTRGHSRLPAHLDGRPAEDARPGRTGQPLYGEPRARPWIRGDGEAGLRPPGRHPAPVRGGVSSGVLDLLGYHATHRLPRCQGDQRTAGRPITRLLGRWRAAGAATGVVVNVAVILASLPSTDRGKGRSLPPLPKLGIPPSRCESDHRADGLIPLGSLATSTQSLIAASLMGGSRIPTWSGSSPTLSTWGHTVTRKGGKSTGRSSGGNASGATAVATSCCRHGSLASAPKSTSAGSKHSRPSGPGRRGSSIRNGGWSRS
jgi:hypothetical protein